MAKLPSFNYIDESHSERLARKSKEAPYVPLGLAGCLGAVAYGAYTFKNRGEMSTSVFLMRFRVIAQSVVVLTLGVGITYSMINEHLMPRLAKFQAKDNGSSD